MKFRVLVALWILGGSVVGADAQRNADVPKGPSGAPSTRQSAPPSESTTKGATGPKETGEKRGGNHGRDTTGGTGKPNTRGK